MRCLLRITFIILLIGILSFLFVDFLFKTDFFSKYHIDTNIKYGIDSAKDQVKYNVLIEVQRYGMFGLEHSLGGGVLISTTGEVLTAKHILQNTFEIRVTLSNGRVFDINNVNDFYVDDKVDIGFINLHSSNLEYAEIADSNEIVKNAEVYSIGNPTELFVNKEFEGKIVNADFKRIFLGKDERHLLIDMRVFHGCSGGGIYSVDTNKLIGINSRAFENYAIAVSSEAILQAIDRFHNLQDD